MAIKLLDKNGLIHFKDLIMSRIPTKVSTLENDSGYLTSIPDEYVTDTELTARIPPASTSDNDKVLSVVNGAPTWVTVVYQTYYTGSAEPSSALGSDGDLYLKT